MSKFRVWIPSRDAYHCAFRFIRILDAARQDMRFETICALDIFLLYPPLLHKMSMTMPMRESFRTLSIERPDDTFLRLPSIFSVAREVHVYQQTALNYLIGKTVIGRVRSDKGDLKYLRDNVPVEVLKASQARNESQMKLIEFLTSELAVLPLDGTEGLLRRTGLPKRAMSS